MTENIYRSVKEKVQEKVERKECVSVTGMLKILGFLKTGYLSFLDHVCSKQEQRKQFLKDQIQKVYDESNQIYGVPKITKELQKKEKISERTVGKYMKEMGIKACWIKPFTIITKDPDLSLTLKNILDEQFSPERPNTVWCSDITYIWTKNGFVYLTSIMDLYSRKIIAWTLSRTLTTACVIDTIKKAKNRRNLDKSLILHSDRGAQYVSKEYKKATKNMTRSYSKKAYPWDNACIESFHSIIKREWLNRFGIENYNLAYRLIFE